jgi:glycerol kinase
MQYQSDLVGVPVIRPKMIETTALGTAYLAGLSAGIWESPEQLSALWQVDKIFEPTISTQEAADRMAVWSKAVERSKNWF